MISQPLASNKLNTPQYEKKEPLLHLKKEGHGDITGSARNSILQRRDLKVQIHRTGNINMSG